ncbi:MULTISPECIES: (4Fe-4S)-binding protein [Deinococcus]|uniref:(4Fe-4S)-binding protein n=1 Tax=Deinococcus rufus TaxID=2136097 RepID=A0ABV7Z5Y0_9DEIO|nr:(4Fe-4S)-binding protein [Deinococcus sp. AB2017081]WQE96127.1 (4Fe-4S)-binding protein [Deinococcus sp. AB2017081]
MTSPSNEDLAQGRAYTAPGITVYYDARRCLHVANCVRGLPDVFDPARRPWIQPANAGAHAVAAVVRTCPTGALHYALDGEEPEMPQEPTTITPSKDGPLMIAGHLVIQTPGGEKKDVRAALCRCGQSGNKPYCDGTHAKVGWRSEEG